MDQCSIVVAIYSYSIQRASMRGKELQFFKFRQVCNMSKIVYTLHLFVHHSVNCLLLTLIKIF